MTEEREAVERILRAVERIYGEVPLVTETLARRPDVLIPFTRLSKAIMYEGEALDLRTRELAAVSAATALGGEHCLDVHLRQALRSGATEEDVFEAMLIGSMMAMTNAQAVSLRKFRELTEED